MGIDAALCALGWTGRDAAWIALAGIALAAAAGARLRARVPRPALAPDRRSAGGALRGPGHRPRHAPATSVSRRARGYGPVLPDGVPDRGRGRPAGDLRVRRSGVRQQPAARALGRRSPAALDRPAQRRQRGRRGRRGVLLPRRVSAPSEARSLEGRGRRRATGDGRQAGDAAEVRSGHVRQRRHGGRLRRVGRLRRGETPRRPDPPRRLDGVEASSGRIDGFAVHRADRLVDPFASPPDPWAG